MGVVEGRIKSIMIANVLCDDKERPRMGTRKNKKGKIDVCHLVIDFEDARERVHEDSFTIKLLLRLCQCNNLI